MARHPYATNSDERKMVPFFLAVLAVFTTFALTALFATFHWTPPASVDVTSTMAIYGVYYWLFKKFCWKWKWLRSVGIVSTPIIEGTWVGTVKTSHAEGAPRHNVHAAIGQDWTDILIRVQGPNSHSRSTSASMTVTEDETLLIYQYLNEPNADAPETLQIHYGTGRVTLRNDELQGEYYTGRGRLNIGTIQLLRKKE